MHGTTNLRIALAALLLYTLAGVSAANSIPNTQLSRRRCGGKFGNPIRNCARKSQRKAWDDLTLGQRKEYISSTLCLTTTPAKHGVPGAKTLWDELHYVHIVQSAYIHFVGAFLPFHRYFLLAHETLLRRECNYRGPIPYWNEVNDVFTFRNSSVFDPITGFGGDGAPIAGHPGGGCITDGPFADLRLQLTANLTVAPDGGYCISRNMSDCLFSGALQENLDACLNAPTFEAHRNCLEAKPHIAGHWGVGGTMSDTLLSPGDPLFFLHHTWLDKLWWEWQSRNLPARLTEISGPNIVVPPPAPPGNGTGGPPPGKTTFTFRNETCSPSGGGPGQGHGIGEPLDTALTDFFGDGGGNVTSLGHVLYSHGILPNSTIVEVMNLEGGIVCAEYV
ncbi:putative amino acid transporter [Rhypophila decipiens]